MTARGRFITLEGIEGVGKSTNLAHVASRIEAQGHGVVRTREPGGTPLAERIRELLLERGKEPLPRSAELLLVFAARDVHLENLVRPALERGDWVVCDRYTDATRAYQGAGRGLAPERIEWLANWVQAGLEPDLTLLLDAPWELSAERVDERERADRFEAEPAAFFERVRAGYLALARSDPSRIRLIDATQPLPEVQAALDAALDATVFRDVPAGAS